MHSRIEAIEQKIRQTEAEGATLWAERAEVVARANAVIVDVDASLVPLDNEVRRGLSEGSRHAEHVRAHRRELYARRSQAESSITQWDHVHGYQLSGLQEHVNDLKRQLPHVRFEAMTDTDLERDEKRAWFNLKAARDDQRIAQDTVDHFRAKLADAHNAVDVETDAVHTLAELTGERETLQADAFIAERPADPGKLADLAAADKVLDRAKHTAAGARAAIGTLEAKIDEQRAAVDKTAERVTTAEAAVRAAVRNRAVRQLATMVDAMREPLLLLEAADPTAGVYLCKALTERGLHTIHVDGSLVRPA